MVEGWFVAESIVCFLMAQLSVQNVAEIGIHHGKSFISMLKCVPNIKQALAIDVFDDQSKNFDQSGLGNLQKFKENLRNANLHDKVIIHEGSSLDLTPASISSKLSDPIQVFSVDGCHTYDCTLSDLHLAFNSITPNGLVILDDHFNTHWPGVSTGLGAFLSQRRDVMIFAYGLNKTFLCLKNFYGTYVAFIEDYCKTKNCIIRTGINGMSDKVYSIN